MSPKREKPLSVQEASEQLLAAKRRYDQAVMHASLRERIAQTEPRSSGRVVRFAHRFGGKTYSYAAIRADNYRGDRRWFITSNDGIAQGGHRGVVSPCTWVELVEFAIPDTIFVAPLTAHWQPVAVPVLPGRNLDDPRASAGVDAPPDLHYPGSY